MSNEDQRYQALTQWLQPLCATDAFNITPLAGDASFRRYYRVQLPGRSYIAMDAPPHQEDSRSFVSIAQLLAKQGLTVPEIYAADIDQGFLLLTDMGDDLYLHCLTLQNADHLYHNAIHSLLTIQSISRQIYDFPSFNYDLLMEELSRFQEWYLIKHLKLELNTAEKQMLAHSFELLINNALEQPQVCVHRDYHSRNLLKAANNQNAPCILDFQDAVWGPITYDLVSLIRDCYISWPKSHVHDWAMYYYQHALQNHILKPVTAQQFTRWFDWMGVQRHLKAIYIFARKFHRDASTAYLTDIPRALNYVLDVTQHYPELMPLHAFLIKRAPL